MKLKAKSFISDDSYTSIFKSNLRKIRLHSRNENGRDDVKEECESNLEVTFSLLWLLQLLCIYLLNYDGDGGSESSRPLFLPFFGTSYWPFRNGADTGQVLLVGVMVGGGNCYFELHYEIILEDAIAFFIGYWVKNRVPKQSHRTIRHNWTQALDTGRYDNIPCQTKKCTFAITILTKLNMKTTVSLFNTNSELLFNRHIIEQKMKVLI